jgi:putative endonuclease
VSQSTRDSQEFRPWRFWKRWLGQRSEQAAAQYLIRLGYRVLATNIQDNSGELDILALDDSTLVFVEVRSSSRWDPIQVAASVNGRKQRKLSAAAKRFLARHRLLGMSARFDVVAITWPNTTQKPIISHFPDAFESSDRFQMY